VVMKATANETTAAIVACSLPVEGPVTGEKQLLRLSTSFLLRFDATTHLSAPYLCPYLKLFVWSEANVESWGRKDEKG